MVDALYGKKIGCTQVFLENGDAVYVTAIEAGPCIVVQVKNKEKDGYNSLQVGIGAAREKKVNKPIRGIFSKNNVDLRRYLKEIRVEDFDKEYKPGDSFHRGRMSHGSHAHRIPGAVGMCATPAKILKGKKMPGRLGNKRVTLPKAEIVDIIPDENLILVKGSVPGAKGSMVYLKKI